MEHSTEITFLDSIYKIAIPKDLQLLEDSGEDFTVFYLSPKDTTVHIDYSAGLYFGNHASEFKPERDSCLSKTETSKILGSSVTWKIYECDSSLSIQTIIDSQSGEDWCEELHAFGKVSSQKDLERVFAIFATLRKR